MNWLIASDIHGSSYYAQKVAEAFAREKAERLVLLGDLLYHGPRNDLPRDYAPKKVIEILNALSPFIFAVRGNCDAEVDQMVLSFPILADYALAEVMGRTMFITHGHLFHQDALPPHRAGDILLHGHTHVAACTQGADYLYLNPGSAALPKDGENSYMTLKDGVFTWKRVETGETLREYRLDSND